MGVARAKTHVEVIDKVGKQIATFDIIRKS